jgi:hypothetical protein
MRSTKTWALGLVVLLLPSTGIFLALRHKDSRDPAAVAMEVRKAADAVWQLKAQGDWLKVWDAFEPRYREKTVQVKYAAGQLEAIKIYGHEIKDVTVAGDSANVTVEFDRSFPALDRRLEKATKVFKDIRSTRGKGTMTEGWVRIDGKWFLRGPDEAAPTTAAASPADPSKAPPPAPSGK